MMTTNIYERLRKLEFDLEDRPIQFTRECPSLGSDNVTTQLYQFSRLLIHPVDEAKLRRELVSKEHPLHYTEFMKLGEDRNFRGLKVIASFDVEEDKFYIL